MELQSTGILSGSQYGNVEPYRGKIAGNPFRPFDETNSLPVEILLKTEFYDIVIAV